MTHHIPVPDRCQRPACSCGEAAPYPFRVEWSAFDEWAEAHLAAYVNCPRHGVQTRNADGRCGQCRFAGQTRNHQPKVTGELE
jgi:hypothetical protein